VGPTNSLFDTNPPAVDASIFASGPGTKLEAFNSKGAGGDPGEVREYRNMVACVLGIPPTFLADMETANLATATSLDRPTELNFLEKQEAWREDLLIIAKVVLTASSGATSGKLREAKKKTIVIREARRRWVGGADSGRWIMEASKKPDVGVVEILVNFPAIVEGDVPQLVAAAVAAATTGLLDDKAVAKQLYDLLPDVDNGTELAEEQYPGTITERQKAKDEAAATAPPPAPGQPVKPLEAVKLARKLIEAVEREK
jgi:hypothetical protein